MLVVLAGLPEPTVNHIIRNETGEWLRRFELAYIELLLAIEYQGRWHRESDEVWEGDIERREELDHRTWRVVEVISKSLNDDPFRVLQRIELARRDRGARPTMRLSEEWRAFSQALTQPADNAARDDLWRRESEMSADKSSRAGVWAVVGWAGRSWGFVQAGILGP